MIFADLSNKLSTTIAKETALDEEKQEILAYAVETTILSIVGTLLVILSSSLFRVLIPALIATFFGGTLRRLSGGAHFNTPLKCLAFGTFMYTLLGILATKLSYFGLVNNWLLIPLVILCLVIAALLAPVESEGKPIISRSFRLKLKMFSIIFIIIVLFILLLSSSSVLKASSVLGITYQCLTLLPIFSRREVRE